MLSAKEMCQIALQSTNSSVLLDIEKRMKEAAEKEGKFFIKLFDVTSGTDSVQCAIMEKYGSNVYRTLERLGYVMTIYTEGSVSSVYIGFAHSSEKHLLVDIANEKE